jgi:hypothetical protein
LWSARRAAGDDWGAMASDRDAYLRVTLATGPEVFWPVADLVTGLRATTFLDYQP